ncbi:MAG: hypothetical protein HGB09_09490 [Chlorobiaceae bacterium]|jgi:hypothetical protein|nr:hypothetical protein [Chlorobiaceae bacterium]
MANNESKGGFFSRLKKGAASASEDPSLKAPAPQAAQTQNRNVMKPESSSSLVSASQPKAPVAPKPAVASPSSESEIDTLAAFSRYCSSLVDIGTSQLKVVEMTLGMLSNSLNKIVDGSKTK